MSTGLPGTPALQPLVRATHAGDPMIRLFCLPYAGGGALAFRGWANELPGDVEAFALRPPGRETRLREPPHTSTAPAVKELADVVEPMLDRPYAIFGHSLGALLTFELARELRRRGLPGPVVLFPSGRAAPQLPWGMPPVADLADASFIRFVSELGGTPPEVIADAELLELFLPLLRADFQMNEQYVYRDELPFQSPIHVFAGTDDPTARQSDVAAWSDQTDGEFGLTAMPGGHFFLEVHAHALLSQLSGLLHRYAGLR